MTRLYLTADRIGSPTGGGIVTYHESEAMRDLGETKILARPQLEDCDRGFILEGVDREDLERQLVDPWAWDHLAYHCFGNSIRLAHVYAGTFSESVKKLHDGGAKVTYTAAAHDVALSKREHELLGIRFDYPHLTDPKLWERYLRGYKEADVLICPSHHSANVMRNFGCTNKIEVIPHGVDLPENNAPIPKDYFTLGYLGAVGPDKGLRYLLEAWAKLAYKDALLIVGGRDSTSPFVAELFKRYGGGNVHFAGWYPNVGEFYSSLSCYCQPSVTEGFGIEVLEAMAWGRMALCSTGAGAVDCVPAEWEFPPANPAVLAEMIDAVKQQGHTGWTQGGAAAREIAAGFTWSKVREAYKDVWRGLQ